MTAGPAACYAGGGVKHLVPVCVDLENGRED